MMQTFFRHKFFNVLLFIALILASCSNENDDMPKQVDEMNQTPDNDDSQDNSEIPDTDNDGISDDDDDDDDGDGLIELFSIDDLNEIRANLTTSKKVFAGLKQEDFKGYEMTKDFDFRNPDDYSDPDLLTAYTTGNGWLPIGIDNEGNSVPFEGTFDGNGFTISNLFMDNTEDTHAYGLFGETGVNSVIRNLVLVNVFVNTESFSVGGLAGQGNGRIENCHVEGVVAGRNRVGLLVGSCEAIEISECSSFGEVTGIDIPVSQSFGVGGLTGGLFLGNSNSNPITLSASITDSFSHAAVNGSRSVGGFIGSILIDAVEGTASVSVRNCYAIGKVTSSDNSGGGFIPGTGSDSSVSIQSCYWDVETSGIGAFENDAREKGLTTAQLQAPTNASGIYADWDTTVWDFGDSNQYPLLSRIP